MYIILSIIIGSLLAIFLWFEILANYFNEIIANIGALLIIIGSVIVGILFSIEQVNYDIEKYQSTKQVIEQSIANDNLSGLERLELVDKIIKENEMIITYQYKAQKWYGWYIPDKVMNIELISLED